MQPKHTSVGKVRYFPAYMRSVISVTQLCAGSCGMVFLRVFPAKDPGGR